MEKSEQGKYAELLAAEHLSNNGYTLIARNYKVYRGGEIDIIAEKNHYLVFVEIKSGFASKTYHPLFQMHPKKIKHLQSAASVYLAKFPSQKEIRFDCISVIFKKEGYDIDHMEDAFRWI